MGEIGAGKKEKRKLSALQTGRETINSGLRGKLETPYTDMD